MAKLLIFRTIYISTLTNVHELWVVSERMRFLRRVAQRHLDIWRELRVEPVLCAARGHLRCSGPVQLAGDTGADSELTGGTIQSIWPLNAPGSPRKNWNVLLWRGTSGTSCYACCHHNQNLEAEGNGWMELTQLSTARGRLRKLCYRGIYSVIV